MRPLSSASAQSHKRQCSRPVYYQQFYEEQEVQYSTVQYSTVQYSTTQYAENDMDTLIVATNSSRRSEELFIIQQTRNFPLSNILLKK